MHLLQHNVFTNNVFTLLQLPCHGHQTNTRYILHSETTPHCSATPITLTPAEQQVYNAVMNSNAILRLQVEIQAAADSLKYDHDYFNLCLHNYMTYPPLVNYSK